MQLSTQTIHMAMKRRMPTPPSPPAIPSRLGIISKAWDESKHPRGGKGTENGGQFVSGGGTAASASSETANTASPAPAATAQAPAAPVTEQKPDGVVATASPAAPEKQAVPTQSPLEGMRDKYTGTGAKDDPIVTKDVLVAAAALHEDKYVKLESKKQISTLLDRLKVMVDEAKAAGKNAKTYDLCLVTVEGSNLFCAESKNIPRAKMPQLGGFPIKGSKADALPRNKFGGVDITDKFVEHLHAAGIAATSEQERSDYLKASQNELNGGKVAVLAKALSEGTNEIRTTPLVVSRDGYIIDGHHRWAATVSEDLKDGNSGDLKMNVIRVDLDIIEILRAATRFAEDWGIPQLSVQVSKSKSGCGNGGCAVNLTAAELVAIFASQQT